MFGKEKIKSCQTNFLYTPPILKLNDELIIFKVLEIRKWAVKCWSLNGDESCAPDIFRSVAKINFRMYIMLHTKYCWYRELIKTTGGPKKPNRHYIYIWTYGRFTYRFNSALCAYITHFVHNKREFERSCIRQLYLNLNQWKGQYKMFSKTTLAWTI